MSRLSWLSFSPASPTWAWTYRTSDEDDFHSAKRQAGPVRIVASLFTVVGASEFVVFTTLAYVYGSASMSFFFGTLLGFLSLAWLAPRIRARAVALDIHSIPDMARTQRMPLARIGLSLLSVLFTCALVVIQIIIGGLLVQQLTATGFHVSALFLMLAVLAYLFWGGYRALLYTDVVQAIVLFLFTAGLVAWFLYGAPTPAQGVGPLTNPGDVPLDLLGLAAGGFFAIFGGPEIWQRVVTCRSDRSARWGLVAAGVIMLAWGLFIIEGGKFIQGLNPTASPDDAFFVFLASDLPAWLLGGILVALLAAILSTADTELFAASIISRKQLGKYTDRLKNINGTRLVVFILGAFILSVAYLTQDILTVYFWLVYLTFAIGPIALALLFRRGGRSARLRYAVTTVALTAAIIVFAALWILGKMISWYPISIAAVASLPLFFPTQSEEGEA
ncbi:MAG TPA: hypothetical protein VLF66_12180 [Thermoanaerobaculia bacterium]|nr:hypothetical protein [Thermoanaerobaculia bacterium]